MLADGEYANLEFTTTAPPNSPGSFMCTVLTLYTDIISAILPYMCIIHADLFNLYVSVYYRRQLSLFRFKDSSLSQKPRHIHEVLFDFDQESWFHNFTTNSTARSAFAVFFLLSHGSAKWIWPLGSNCEHANFLDCSVWYHVYVFWASSSEMFLGYLKM